MPDDWRWVTLLSTEHKFGLEEILRSAAVMPYDWMSVSLRPAEHKSVQEEILWLQNRISTLDRLENVECINTYSDLLQTTRSDVLVVVSAPETGNQTLLGAHELNPTSW